MDLENAKENLKEFKKKLNKDIKIFEISAINNEGLEPVLTYLADLLDQIKVEPLIEEEDFEDYVLYKFKYEEPFTITKEGNYYIIKGDEVEKLFRMTKFNSDEAIIRFAKKLTKMGIDQKLEEMGAKSGDKIKILDFEFEYRA